LKGQALKIRDLEGRLPVVAKPFSGSKFRSAVDLSVIPHLTDQEMSAFGGKADMPQCPLFPRKQTSKGARDMSALCQ
jgi:hypothetical protein